MSRLMTVKNLAFGAVLAGSLGLGGAGLALAQEEAVTPSHPAHIHAGTCEELDPNPIGPLNNVEPRLNEESEDESEDPNAPQGVLTATTVLYSLSEEVEVPWEDMLAESHAVNIHESDENIENYIACGDIGGVVVDGELVIALHPSNDSGYSGIAVLTEDEDGNVDVEVYLAEPGDDTPDATPVA